MINFIVLIIPFMIMLYVMDVAQVLYLMKDISVVIVQIMIYVKGVIQGNHHFIINIINLL